MITDLDGANCVGKHDLFDSTLNTNHAIARDLCAGCPVLGKCAVLLRDVQTTTNAMRNSGGGPSGTWAGKLLGKTGYPGCRK